MYRIFAKSWRTGRVTGGYPNTLEAAPPGYRGKPEVIPSLCTGCGDCATACPTQAIAFTKEGGKGTGSLSLGSCIFCGLCQEACRPGAILSGGEYELASRSKAGLLQTWTPGEGELLPNLALEERVREKIKGVLGRSCHIRHLDTGSCNGCDFEINTLVNPVYDVQRLGLDFVASPRHADLFLVTGAMTRHLEIAALKTYEAAPKPRVVVAVGACACSGGIWRENFTAAGGADKVLPVDVYIPGCPPRPQALIYGILLALDHMEKRGKS